MNTNLNQTIKVQIPAGENGMIGRECLECKKYFKVKPGTGLPTSYCHCPYCNYEGQSDTFWTQEQIDYAQSVALKELYNTSLKPMLRDFGKSIERSNRSNSFLQIKVTHKEPHFNIRNYKEKN